MICVYGVPNKSQGLISSSVLLNLIVGALALTKASFGRKSDIAWQSEAHFCQSVA